MAQTYTFTNAGANGATGPNQAQIDAAYTGTDLQGNVISAGGIQEWTVPFSGVYHIDATGASGGGEGRSSNAGGLGASMSGDFLLNQGDVIRILVGQKGEDGCGAGGGGGGTYVVRNGTLLLAAGGGGGATSDNNGGPALTGFDGGNDFPGGTTPGGIGGGGGDVCTGGSSVSHGGAGAGYLGDGATAPVGLSGFSNGEGGKAFVNGGTGGAQSPLVAGEPVGGFGGGGGVTSCTVGGGGGGGYSGGAGGQQINSCTPGIGRSGGGGGGSYNAGFNPVNVAGTHNGNGSVSIAVPLSGGHNDAGVAFLNSPIEFCPGSQTVSVTINNYGENIVNGVNVNWSVDGATQAPVAVSTPLDIYGGTGSSTLQVTLGNYTFASGVAYDVRVWTSSPNGVTDTVPSNDTLKITLMSGLSAPIGFTSSNVNSFSVDLSWSFTAPGYEIIYGPTGFNPATGGTVTTASASPYTLNTLSSTTDYDIYLYATCGGGVTSDTVGPISITTLCAPVDILSGTYTIDGSQPTGGTNFNSFTDLTNKLNTCGISGPVTFNIQPGTYTDKLHLFSISGVSSVNTITFNGTGQDTLIWDQTGEQAAVLLDNTQFVTLNNMVIVNEKGSEAWGVLLINNSDGCTISNTTILMDSTSTSSDNTAILVSSDYDDDLTEGGDVDNLTITGCTIVGGYYALNLEGKATDDPSFDYIITDNEIRQFYIAAIYADELENIEISRNTIFTDRGTSTGDGLYLLDINNYHIEGNNISVGDYGLYISNGNENYTVTTNSTIINNMVLSTSDYAMYLNDFDNTDIFHNTSLGEPGIRINEQEAADIRNNIFASTGDYAFESDGALGSGDVVNYNLYYSPVALPLHVGLNDFANLRDWKVADPSNNVNSLEGDPIFASASDLHIEGALANESGDNSVGVTIDVDGDTRPSGGATIVDIGADEYVPPVCPQVAGFTVDVLGFNDVTFSFENIGDSYEVEVGTCGFAQGTGAGTIYTGVDPFTISSLIPNTCYEVYARRSCGTNGFSPWAGPFTFTTDCSPAQKLSGSYTIDPGQPTAGTNFTSFADAMVVLYDCGISGPVVFNIAAGTYSGSLQFTEVNGASATNTITFRSNNVSSVILTHSSTTDEPTVYLDGGDYFIFKKLTIQNTSTSDGWGVLLQHGADYNTIDSCLINMPITTTTDIMGITASNSLSSGTARANNANYLTVSNCEIRGGEIGINLQGGLTAPVFNLGHTIVNNTFRKQDDHAIETFGIGELTIIKNDVDSLVNSSAYAVYLNRTNDFIIEENRIVGPDWALYMLDANDGYMPTTRSRIVNNMITSYGDYGLYLNNFEATDVFHNSVLAEPAFRINDQVDVDVRNNIFASTGDFAFESDDDLTATDVVDYNQYYSTGTNAFDIGTNVYADLAAWQTGDVTRNANSVEGNPLFTETYDLHVNGTLSNEAGDNSVGVTVDIDGDVRPSAGATIVDIGADEYTPPACPDLASGVIDFVTFEGGQFTFDDPSSTYNMEFGPCGFNQGTGTTFNNLSNNPTITTLASNTCFDAYVQRDCGGSGKSGWFGPITFTTLCSPSQKLSGTYTINNSLPPSATNFTSFGAVESILNACGILGPVTFNVGSGTYNEQMELINVPGISATNTITFQADPANTSPAEVVFAASASAENFVFRFTDMSYVTVRGLTLTATGTSYSKVIDMDGRGEYITIEENTLNGSFSPSSVSSHNYDIISNNTGAANIYNHCIIRKNEIHGGTYCIYLYGISSELETGNVVDSNVIIDHVYSAISMNYQENLQVRGNTINSPGTSATTYGIYSQYGQHINIVGNNLDIKAVTTGYGIYLDNDDGSAADPNLVANNMVSVLDNSGTTYGIYAYRQDTTWIYHNSVLVNSTSATGGRALYINKTSTEGSDLQVVNNSFVNSGAGFAVEVASNASSNYITQMDYNNLYSLGTDLGKFGATSTTDLTAWKVASTFDANSLSGNPLVLANNDLHVVGPLLDNMGTPLAQVTIDIDGDVRSATTPDIGADEYAAASCLPSTLLTAANITATSAELSWTPGSGTDFNIEYGPVGFTPGTGAGIVKANVGNPPYTLTGLSEQTDYDFYVQDICGGTGTSPWSAVQTFKTRCLNTLNGTYTIDLSQATGTGNFASFAEAADELNNCGISGPVTFNIQAGNYTDHLHLFEVEGISPVNTITFNGTGQDTLIWDQTGPQAAVLLDGTKFVTLNNMNIVNELTSEAWGVLLTNNSDSCNILNTTILMDSTTTSSDKSAILVSNNYVNDLGEGGDVDYLTVNACTLVGGYYTMNFEGNATGNPSYNYYITDNIIRNFYLTGIYVDEIQNLYITGNTITTDRGAGNGDGMYIYDANNYFIEGNTIIVGDYGIYISDGNDGFTATVNSTIVNNMIVSSDDYGLYLNDFESTDVFHNSVVAKPAIRINDQDGLDVRNNIFYSDGDFAFESDDALATGDVIDYNMYFSNNTNAFDIGTSVYADLAAWQAGDATRNLNSREGNPGFAGPDDLHASSYQVDNAGDNTVGVTVDIDGDVRPAAGSTTVDIGADEFDGTQDDIAILEIIAPNNNDCGDSNTVVGVVFQNQAALTATGFTIEANISGAGTANLSDIYTGNLLSNEIDTMFISSFNSVAGGTYTIQAVALYTADANTSNDTLEVSIDIGNVLAPEPTAENDTLCVGQTTQLYFPVNTDDDYFWVTASGDTIGTQDSITVGPIGVNDTTFNLLVKSQASYQVGPVDNTFGGGSNSTLFTSYQMLFTTYDNITLDSVAVYTSAATGTVVVSVNDATGTMLQTTSVTVTASGKMMVPLDFDLAPGSYELDASGTSGVSLFRNTGGAVYPYSVPGIIDITGQNFSSGPDYLYWFYDWHLTASGCPRPAGEITIYTQDEPVAAFSKTINAATPTDRSVDFDAGTSTGADSYEWDFGDGSAKVNGETTNHAYTANGNYTVTLVVSNACGSDTITDTFDIEGISVEENPISRSLALYPNPTAGSVRVSFDTEGSEDVSLTVLDLSGKRIMNWNFTHANGRVDEELDLTDLATGTYVLQIESGNMRAIRRVIKN
ncbi:MAG: hypothetical protein CMI35_17235 [Owenweeksia sp.]|nr:hypothetical protein [Owenweeksia sp.]